jgi:hypothetical protein
VLLSFDANLTIATLIQSIEHQSTRPLPMPDLLAEYGPWPSRAIDPARDDSSAK